MVRRCFYSFHYKDDVTRVARIRQIGTIEGNRPTTDNNWEKIKSGGEEAIKKWIKEQMKEKSCTIVLVGSKTANRPWINYEIIESWNSGMGVVGIYIHGLKNLNGETSLKGDNPFDYIKFEGNEKKLSSIVKCYNPTGKNSRNRYAWISNNLAQVVEQAIQIRNVN